MLLAIGRISGTHGLRGDVKVESYSGEFEHFGSLERVLLRKGDEECEVTVEGFKRSGGKGVLSIRDVNTVDEAAGYRGWELWVPRDGAAPLGSEEYYIADLLGLSVYHEQKKIGNVAAVYEDGQGALLEDDLGDRSAMVPLLSVYIGEIDLDSGSIELLVRWILE